MMNLFKSLLGGVADGISAQRYKAEYVDGKKPHTLIDVRSAAEYEAGHIPGALNIDVSVIASRVKDIPGDRPVVLYCRSGNRSGMAAGTLRSSGFGEVLNLGALGDWQSAGFPVKSGRSK